MTIEVHLDRDSVAAGDDTQGHEATLSLPAHTTLDQLLNGHYRLALASPGACWVISVGEEQRPIGVWTEQWGHCRLADPARNTLGSLASNARLDLRFGYHPQLDADVVVDLLAAGVTSLRDVYAAVADDATSAEVHRQNLRASATSARLFTPQAIAALERVGATVRAHSDIALYLRASDRTYEAHTDDRNGPMIQLTAPKDANANYWWMLLSHADDAARLLLGAIGERTRELAGLEPYPWPAHELPLDDSTDRWNGNAHWFVHGRRRHADFGHGPTAPEPFAHIVKLPLETIAAAYAVGGQS